MTFFHKKTLFYQFFSLIFLAISVVGMSLISLFKYVCYLRFERQLEEIELKHHNEKRRFQEEIDRNKEESRKWQIKLTKSFIPVLFFYKLCLYKFVKNFILSL